MFGIAGTIIEIPITTTLMMRSIQDIARSENHDITESCIQLECLSVFSHGSKTNKKGDAADVGYYADRIVMAEMISEAAKELSKIAASAGAKQLTATKAGHWLAKLINMILTRFGIAISEKVILQAAPLIGAFTGATINSLFMDFYQDIARGHFIVLRLEKVYGEEVVKQEFEIIQNRSEAVKVVQGGES